MSFKMSQSTPFSGSSYLQFSTSSLSLLKVHVIVFLPVLICVFTCVSVGNAVLNMHQGYLGHVIRVTQDTCTEYVACTSRPHTHGPGLTRVCGRTCSILTERWSECGLVDL